jgi:hypothetical protein
MKQFDTQKTYDNVVNHFKFGGLDKPGLYLDETVMRMCFTHRRLLSQLVSYLMQEGDSVKVKEILNIADTQIPSYNVPHDYQSGSLDLIRGYLYVDMKDKAEEIISQLWTKSTQYLLFYCSLSPIRLQNSERECMFHFYVLQHLAELSSRVDNVTADARYKELNDIAKLYQSRGGHL